jgi:hypothetical protein
MMAAFFAADLLVDFFAGALAATYYFAAAPEEPNREMSADRSIEARQGPTEIFWERSIGAVRLEPGRVR